MKNHGGCALFAQNPDATILLTLDGTILDANESAAELTGWPADHLMQANWSQFLVRGSGVCWDEIVAGVTSGKPGLHEVAFRHRDGRTIHLCVKTVPLMDGDQATGLVLVAGESTFHDPLTQLPNRALFMQQLREAQAAGEADSEQFAVLYLDLDGFKAVNDSLGHITGDALLVAVARRLRSCVPHSGLVARMGGDEFAVMHRPGGRPDVESTLRLIQQAIQQPFSLDGQDVVVSTSIGVVFGTESGDADDFLRYAGTAMYAAKRLGRGQYAVFDRAMARRATERFRLEIDLRSALDRSEFFLCYQPIVNLATCAVSGFEALIRWRHPERGVIPPGEFIPLAEETGLIVPIGKWALREACAQLRAWQTANPQLPDRHVNVNISMRQIKEPSFVDVVAEILRETGLDPHHLRLELTETMLAHDVEATARTLCRLKGLGVMLVIDDFGTGYSSLNYLRWFPVDVVKIDRAFVAGLGKNPVDTAIVRGVIGVAKTLGLLVTGEGIESAEQLAYLLELGCDMGQGFYFGPPSPAAALSAFVAAVEH